MLTIKNQKYLKFSPKTKEVFVPTSQHEESFKQGLDGRVFTTTLFDSELRGRGIYENRRLCIFGQDGGPNGKLHSRSCRMWPPMSLQQNMLGDWF